MKLSIGCLVIAIIARLTFELVAQNVITKPATEIQVSGGVTGNTWLTVHMANKSDPAAKPGFDPSFTYLLCDYQPIIHRMSNGRYEIMFTSEIAKDLP